MLTPQMTRTAARLLEALEKLSQSAGAGLQSGGPSGQPPDELVRAFQQALTGPEKAEGGQDVSGPARAVSDTDWQPGYRGPGVAAVPPEPGPAERMPPLDGVERAGRPDGRTGRPGETPLGLSPEVSEPQGVRRPGESPAMERRTGETGVVPEGSPTGPDDPLKELGRLLEQISQPGAALQPTDVYRMQYLVGMLKVRAQAGQKASQGMTQGMESVLRQSG